MVAVIIAVAVWIAIRIIAGTNTGIGMVFRWFWNLSFTIASYIPFCGWMAHFIIAKDDAEKARKEEMIKVGEQTDQSTADYLEKKAQQEKAEAAAREAEAAQREQERRNLQDELRAKTNNPDLSLNSDGTMARPSRDADFVPVNEIKKSL